MDYVHREFEKCQSPADCSETYARLKNWSGAFQQFNIRLIQLQRAGHRLVPLDDGSFPSAAAEWYTLRTLNRKRARKFRVETEDLEFTVKPVKVSGLQNILPYMMLLFNDMFRTITKALPRNSNVQMVFENDQLREPIVIKTMSSKSLSADLFFNNLTKVLQSYQDFNLQDRTVIRVTKFDGPKKGGGYPHRRGNIAIADFLVSKRSVISIAPDGLCFGRAVVIGRALADGLPWLDSKLWQKLRTFRPGKENNFQKEQALKLYSDARVVAGSISVDQISAFSRQLPGYKIQVWGGLTEKDCLYRGQDGGREINLFFHDGHYSVIKKMASFFGKRKQCPDCGDYVKSTDPEQHKCRGRCSACRRKATQCKNDLATAIHCSDCARSFWNNDCYVAHTIPNKTGQSICSMYSFCPDCKVSIRNSIKRYLGRHSCGERYCKNCSMVMPLTHTCYIKVHSAPPRKNAHLVICDFEARFDEGTHVPIAAVAKYSKSGELFSWTGEDTQDEFCSWLLHKRHTDHVALFHNLSGYDGHFIMNYLARNKIKPKIIKRGQKIVEINITEVRLIIRDSLNFLLMPLAAMAKSFGLEEREKGHFPHLFSCQKNYEYSGSVPAKRYFLTNSLNDKALQEFHQWHDQQRKQDTTWRFWPELLKYCVQDVEILSDAVSLFSENMENLTGYNPFLESPTLPGFVNLVLRSNHLPAESVALLPYDSSPKLRQNSAQAMQWLYYVSTIHDLDIRHERNNPGGEVRVMDLTGREYRVDGYAEKNGRKYVFEFNGCYWHGCPLCFDSDAPAAFGLEKNSTLYRQTRARRRKLIEAGYCYTEIWGHQFERLMKMDAPCRAIIEHHKSIPIMNVRDVLRGGRCEAFRLLHEVGEGEKISYLDVNSLYPSILRGTPERSFPIGKPSIITRNFKPLSLYFGIVHVRVLPPRKLELPVLPLQVGKKIYYALCFSCVNIKQTETCSHCDEDRSFDGVFTTPELQLAVKHGYEVAAVYEVWHYPSSSSTLFTSFIDRFYKLKVQNSGWPKTCQTEHEKNLYLTMLKSKYNIDLQPSEIVENPTQRLIAKIMLNSSWGRFALRPGQSSVEWVSTIERLSELVYSEFFDVQGIDVLCDGSLLQVQYRHADDHEHRDIRSNVVLAGFVTSYARMVLYEAMAAVGPDNLLYTDTDSIICIEKDGQCSLPVGEYLGDFQSELQPGEYICYFACGGPKCYAYETNYGLQVFKAKGVRIDQGNRDTFQLHNLQRMVRDPSIKFKTYNPFYIHRPRGQYALISRELTKTFQFTYDKRILLEDYSTQPYGIHRLRKPVDPSFQPNMLGCHPGREELLDCPTPSEADDLSFSQKDCLHLRFPFTRVHSTERTVRYRLPH